MRPLPATALLLALTACDGGRAPIEVREAYVVLPPVSGRPASAYFDLRSSGDAGLTGVSSPAAARIELHKTVEVNGLTSMRPVEPADVTFEDGAITFEPGRKHAMVHGLSQSLQPGSTIALTFTFQRSEPITVQAPVRAFSGHGGH